jgi:predicted transcriptional regulator of viral defense system
MCHPDGKRLQRRSEVRPLDCGILILQKAVPSVIFITEYIPIMTLGAGIEQRNRRLLDQLHRSFSRPFSVAEAAHELSLDRTNARRLLANLADRGWLSRIRRDSYAAVPLGATSPSEWREDPWVVGATVFTPCYLGGWTACEHWEFTDQLFRDIIVVTQRHMRERLIEIQDTRFHLKVIPPEKRFGTRPVWRGQNKVEVSDPSRTIVDILDDPKIGGGIRHVADVLVAYFDSEHSDEKTLITYIARFGNRTIYKRLGYLIETLGISAPHVIELCREYLSAGLSLLDPSVRAPSRITKRWNLRVNVSIKPIAEKS